MLDNADVRIIWVAELKANTVVLSGTSSGATEIREKDWQGEDFSYPNIRVTASVRPGQCLDDVDVIISYFSQQKSSKEAIVGQGIIAKQYHDKPFTRSNVRFAPLQVVSIPDAVQSDNGVWKADVILRMKASAI